jgi:hypothetical protein
MVAGTCLQNTFTAAECASANGTVGCNTPPPAQNGSCNLSATAGTGCAEGWSRSECEEEDGTFTLNGTCSAALFPFCMDVYRNCTAATEANKAACFNSDRVLVTSGLCKQAPAAYCDFGLPHSAGGGCFPIFTIDDISACDAEYAKVSLTGCGRTDLSYCRYNNGKCYNIENTAAAKTKCTGADSGTNYDECPLSTFEETFYCYDGDGYGDCDKIGGLLWSSARECVRAGGLPITRSWCLDAGAEIYNF